MRTIFANNQELLNSKKTLILSDASASGAGSFSVESIVGAAINQILFIGEPGAEDSEVIKTHAGTAPSGSTVTLATNLVYAHDQGTPIYIIDWDQVEISYEATIGAGHTVLDTIALQADQIETQYTDNTYSSGYYYIRFKNTITTVFSDYSDPIPWGGWAQNQVGRIIEDAMAQNKLNKFTEFVTHQFCIREICTCLTYIRKKLKKWHSMQQFDYSLGKTARGTYKFAMPSDCWKYSNKSVLNLRIGTGTNLTYKDKHEWEEELEGVAHTTLVAGVVAGATSLYLTNPGDFKSSGTIMIAGQDITYTALDMTTGEATGIPAVGTGAITANISTGDDIWQGEEEGEPEIFTVVEGYILVYPLCSSNNINKNVWLDYWTEAPSVDSDADEIDEVREDAVRYWLTWMIRNMIKNDGKRDYADGDWVMFADTVKDAISIELKTSGQKSHATPYVNTIIH
jgi:hypothetical protein